MLPPLPIVPTGYTLHIYVPQTHEHKTCDYLARLVRPDGSASMEWTLICPPRRLTHQVYALLETIDAMLDGEETLPVYYGVLSTSSEDDAEQHITERGAVATFA